MENVVAPVGNFTAEQLQLVSNSLLQAIDNVLETFVSLLPLFVVVIAVAFGIQMVYAIFNSLCTSSTPGDMDKVCLPIAPLGSGSRSKELVDWYDTHDEFGHELYYRKSDFGEGRGWTTEKRKYAKSLYGDEIDNEYHGDVNRWYEDKGKKKLGENFIL